MGENPPPPLFHVFCMKCGELNMSDSRVFAYFMVHTVYLSSRRSLDSLRGWGRLPLKGI